MRSFFVAAATAALASAQDWNWCQSGRLNWTICNPDAPIDDRVADIVSRLSLADKISALGTSTPSLNSVGLPAYNWWSEATHGISHVSYTNSTPWASNTALPITTSASFNRSLWYATGNQIGREARAFMNQGDAYSTYWAPVINSARDPRWGRILECPGEDPMVLGQYAISFVQGFEHAPEDPFTLQASACCKHFVANELDNSDGTDRDHVDVNVTAQDLADSYLPPFQDCVETGKVSGIMCSYNAVNGVPSCANDWLLGTVLRQTWQFDGYVTSDCDADSDVYFDHHYTATPEEAVQVVLRAGTDVDCGSFVPTYAGYALGNGTITMNDIDTVLSRLFRVRIRLGHFSPPGPLATIGTDQICNPYAIELARDGARQGTVLLKNTGNTLPLTLSSVKNAIMVGPNSFLNDTTLYYAGKPCFNGNYRPIDALTQYIPAATAITGVPDVASNDTSGVAAAAAAAANSDLVILAIGSDLMLEREGHDRTSIAFSDGQLALISAVAAAAKGTVIAWVFSGGAMDVSPLLSNPKISAVLHVGQPSVQVIGVADVVFGQTLDGTRNIAPAGRMSQSILPADYVNQVSIEDFNMRPGPSVFPPYSNPGRTHRFYTGTPVLPFGFGLSYTTWNYTAVPGPTDASGAMALVTAALEAEEQVVGHIPHALKATAADYYINVTNTGTVDSDDVVLGFIVPPGAGTNGTPLQELFGFERVFVPAGQTVTVYLGVQARFFTQVQADGLRAAWPGDYTVRFGVREAAQYGMGLAEVRVTV